MVATFHSAFIALLGTLFVVFLSSCQPMPDVLDADAVLAEAPASFEVPVEVGDAATLAWWQAMQEEGLDAFIDAVMAANADWQVAHARILASRAQTEAAWVGLFPSVAFSADRASQSLPTNTGSTARFSSSIPGFPDRFDVTTFNSAVAVNYEIDLWGRLRHTRAVALADYQATQADVVGLRMAIVANAVTAWFAYQDAVMSARLAEENVDLLEERVQLTEDRYDRGLTTSFELFRLRQSLEEAKATLPLSEAQVVTRRNDLARQVGTYATDLIPPIPTALRQPAWSVQAQVPATILRHRPDIIAAGYRLEIARRQVGIARAEQFPKLNLTTSLGTQSNDIEGLTNFDQYVRVFNSGLVAPVFNAGALRANTQAARYRYEQAAIAYEQAVRDAFHEVQRALTTHGAESARYEATLAALDQAQATVATQEERFRRGLGDYLAYLDARLAMNRTALSAVAARSALAGSFILVQRTLGGTWFTPEQLEPQRPNQGAEAPSS
jgi:NodT family efflux transporter outer membrane factor (OMF) lipoprotein